jgi:hypothetical protein
VKHQGLSPLSSRGVGSLSDCSTFAAELRETGELKSLIERKPCKHLDALLTREWLKAGGFERRGDFTPLIIAPPNPILDALSQ